MGEPMPESRLISGSCHCGALRIVWQTARDPGELAPHACDCSFCCKHGAAWVADVSGRARVMCDSNEHLTLYRQGAELADFLLCARCGVVVAVVLDEGQPILGALNASCLDASERFAPLVSASPQRLDAEAKLQRWRQLWMPMTIEPGSRSD